MTTVIYPSVLAAKTNATVSVVLTPTPTSPTSPPHPLKDIQIANELKQWQKVLKEKRAGFHKVGRDLFEPTDYADFSAYLKLLATRYSRKPVAKVIDGFANRLGHLQSFAQAISSMAQADDTATLVWGGLQIILECAVRHSSHLQDTIDILSELNDAMIPLFEHSTILYGDVPELHYPLRDMFSDFADYCIKTAEYLSRPAWLNFLRSPIDSKPQARLKALKQSIEKNSGKLSRAIDKVHREGEVLHRNEMLKGKLARGGPSAHPAASSISSSFKPVFPIETGRPTRNYKFCGRSEILKELSSVLKPPQPGDPAPKGKAVARGAACCVIHGLGGIGKTQTALEYAYAYETDYDAIFWLRSETEAELSASYSAIAVKLRLRELFTPAGSSQGSASSGADENMNIEAAREWLETTDKRWLLVFDNVEDIESIQRFIPRSSTARGSIVITTQRPNFEQITETFRKIPLPSLSSSESIELLFKYLERDSRGDEETSKAFEITNIVGGLPLAITTISGSIHMTNLTVAEFLTHIKRSDNIWGKTETTRVQGYERSLGSVFELALDKLPENSRKLINLLGFLNPDSVPEDMLLDGRDLPGLEFLGSPDELTAMLADLKLRQLVQREPSGPNGPFLSLHRSLQLSILHMLSQEPDTRLRIFRQALDLIRKQLPPPSETQGFEHSMFAKYKVYVPQLISLHTHSLWPEPKIQLDLDFAKIAIDIGTYLWRAGQFNECDSMLQTAEDILESAKLPKDHVLFSDIDDVLGVICDRSGALRRDDALRRRLRAVGIREKVFAEIPPDKVTLKDKIRLYNAHANLACTYIHHEDFDEANRLMEECLKQYLTWGTEDELPFEYSKYYHHSAIAILAQGRVKEALVRAERSVELQERDPSPLRLLGIAYKCRHAIILYYAGEVDKSIAVLEECIARFKLAAGNTNTQTLDTYLLLAGIHMQKGEYIQAKEYLEHCLKPAHRAGWSEVGIAMAEFRMADVKTKLEGTAAGEPHAKIAQEAREKYLAHPDAGKHFKGIEGDPQAIHDQMLCFWHGRFTGKITQASCKAAVAGKGLPGLY